MIIVRLDGGLGNQMFQYAFGRRLAHARGTELKLDVSPLVNRRSRLKTHVVRHYDLDIFNIEPTIATDAEVSDLSRRVGITFFDRALNKLVGRKSTYVVEPQFHFSEAMYALPDDVYVAGYWQSSRYFSEIESLIRKDFSFREELSPLAAELAGSISESNSVCVNVRRGDFLSNSFHGSYGVDYFRDAEGRLGESISDPEYFVFSDDIEWCEKYLRFGGPTRFVSHEYAGPKFQDYLRLMAACKHFIIPNSSFAWWAVWLNTNEDRTVIAPQRWFQDPNYDTSDLIPANWIRV